MEGGEQKHGVFGLVRRVLVCLRDVEGPLACPGDVLLIWEALRVCALQGISWRWCLMWGPTTRGRDLGATPSPNA